MVIRAAAFAAIFALSGCSSDDDSPAPSSASSCAPAGTYTVTFSRASDPGDCAATLQPANTDVDVKANDACGNYSETDHATTTDGCAETITVTATASGSGFTNGKAVIKLDCAAVGGSACTANFSLYFQKRLSRPSVRTPSIR